MSPDRAALDVLFADDEAMVDYTTPAIPKDIPEVLRPKELEQNYKNIVDGRATLKANTSIFREITLPETLLE